MVEEVSAMNPWPAAREANETRRAGGGGRGVGRPR
jgi:hypothetical protein